ncbi:sigma-54-dependent Fis family transcriptional regulator [Derxia gummosa]|uniref:Sigma-54-dependent Fis family transcriptional regulator n=1 Tax=Derxia gummosa DSM 723 TaxID=1121388 RepID=A0A8B6X740_9BURK|nr:sigma-54-dependent Fis family transcriptional regulator [Derxia gummosa]
MQQITRGHDDDQQPALADRIARSWQRSVEHYRLDPHAPRRPRILGSAECRELRERSEVLLRAAQSRLTRLERQIVDGGYCVLLTNERGETIDFRGGAAERVFGQRGLRIGACWSEDEEGTNGVGTALVDCQPTLVHKHEHFRAHNAAITCSAAPILGPDGRMLGVLNATNCDAPDDRRSQAMVFRLVRDSALAIEDAVFADTWRHAWLLRLSAAGESGGWDDGPLIAFDDGGRVLAASHRLQLGWRPRAALPDCQLADLFELPRDGLTGHAHRHPGQPVALRHFASGALFHGQLRAPARALSRPVPREAAAPAEGFDALAVGDPEVRQLVDRIKRLADSRLSILLLGETGSGKEAFARAIHAHSQRRERPFVAVNCAAIPDTLIESELFGYKEGAFTGAKSRGMVGKIQLADGGTLFLDEIGDMPLASQTRLLRVLAEGEVMALGATRAERVDLHVVCATHRDLAAMVAEGRFREDLYYRLNAATFRLPPLRERADRRDVIAAVFADETHAAGRDLALGEEVLDRLDAYDWPGNIRELRNVLRYAIAVCAEPRLRADHLPAAVLAGPAQRPRAPRAEAGHPPRAASATSAAALGRRTGHAASERSLAADRDECLRLRQALADCGGHAPSAARRLGMSRATFYRRLKDYGIAPGRAGED